MTSIGFVAPELRRLEQCQATVIAAFRFQEQAPLQGVLSLVDWRLHGHLSRLLINGFLSSAEHEVLLVPLSARLPQQHLLLGGLGERRPLSAEAFHAAVSSAFAGALNLRHQELLIVLPGRPEELVETAKAVEWLLEAYEPRKSDLQLTVAEPLATQKAMLPLVERWRLRQLVP